MNKYYDGIKDIENKINKKLAEGIMDEKAKREILMKMALVQAAKEATKNPRINVMDRANSIFKQYMKNPDRILETEMKKENKNPEEEIRKLREQLYLRQLDKHRQMNKNTKNIEKSPKISEVAEKIIQNENNSSETENKEKIEYKTESRSELVKRKLAEAAKRQEEINKKIIEEQANLDKKALIETIEKKAEEARKARIEASNERKLADEIASKARQEADIRASRERLEADLKASRARQEADVIASMQRRMQYEQEKMSQEKQVEEKVEELAKDNEQSTIDLNAKRSQYTSQKMIDIYVSDQKKKEEQKEFKIQQPFISTIKNVFNRMTSSLNPYRIKKAQQAYEKTNDAKEEFERAKFLEKEKRMQEQEKNNGARKTKQRESFGSKFFQRINEKEVIKKTEKNKNKSDREPDFRERFL